MNLFLEFLVALVVGSLLHELTHLWAAWLIGRRAAFSLRDYSVNYEADLPPGPSEYFIAGSPLFFGLIAGSIALIVFGVPGLPVVFGWVLYTFVGAVTQDFSFERSRVAKDQSN